MTGIDVRLHRAHTQLVELLASDPDQDWHADALCRQVDPDLWFPEVGGSTREAKKVCERCPVRSECLQQALANHERFGVWGGVSERDRRQLERGRAA